MKMSRLSVVISRRRFVLSVLVFQGSLAVIITVINCTEKRNRQLLKDKIMNQRLEESPEMRTKKLHTNGPIPCTTFVPKRIIHI